MQYKIWNGASAIVIDSTRILMVRGKGANSWGVPSGEIEEGETSEVACIREVWEETGYKVKISKTLHTKNTTIEDYDVTTTYFLCEIIGGSIQYHDPDELVEEIAWKSVEEIENIEHAYPEDKEMIKQMLISRK
ncbi:NUDIX hydrolase [Metasolibacillus meyeri]|uniref:NUDIX hydrolase n=1 Tax=Metasolibacillus meyeri TaxID=1071052 RepID=UPI000D314BA5|nr:NUDIX hydrolase [Metasolibacillus meyeri]